MTEKLIDRCVFASQSLSYEPANHSRTNPAIASVLKDLIRPHTDTCDANKQSLSRLGHESLSM
jgi:hypothetical protein